MRISRQPGQNHRNCRPVALIAQHSSVHSIILSRMGQITPVKFGMASVIITFLILAYNFNPLLTSAGWKQPLLVQVNERELQTRQAPQHCQPLETLASSARKPNSENILCVFAGRWEYFRINFAYIYRSLRKNGGVIDREGVIADKKIHVSEMIDKLSKISMMIQGLPPSLNALPVELAIALNTSAFLLQQVNRQEPVRSGLNQIGPTAWSRILEITIANFHRVFCAMGIPETNQDIEKLLEKIAGIAHLVPGKVMSLLTLQCCVFSLGHMINGQHQDACRILDEVLKMDAAKTQDDNQKSLSAFLIDIPNLKMDPNCCSSNSSLFDARQLARFLLVACLFQTNQWADCLHHINTDHSDLPESLKLTQMFIQGYCIFQTGDAKSAMKPLTSLAANPGTDVALKVKTINLIGCCLATLHKPYTAMQKFQEALKMKFRNLCPLYNISVVYRHLGLEDAEIKALHLLIKAFKDKVPSEELSESDVILGSLPSGSLSKSDGMYILDEGRLNVLLVMHTLAKRCSELGRYNDATKKYSELLEVLKDNDLSHSTKHPIDFKEDFSCLPPLHTIFLEAALSYYRTNDIDQSLTVINRIAAKMIPQNKDPTRSTDVASNGLDADQDTRRQTDALPGPSFHGDDPGCGEFDIPVTLPHQPSPSNAKSQTVTVPKHPSEISFKLSDVSVKSTKEHVSEEAKNCQESGQRLFIANTLLLKSNCLIQTKNSRQALSVTNELLEYLSGVVRTDDLPDEAGSCSREAEFEMEVEEDEETPRSKKRKIEATDDREEGNTRKRQPTTDSLLQVKARAYNNKATILIGQKKTSEALHLLVLGTQYSPGDCHVLYNYTLLLTQMGRAEEARKTLKKLVTLDTNLQMSPLSKYLS